LVSIFASTQESHAERVAFYPGNQTVWRRPRLIPRSSGTPGLNFHGRTVQDTPGFACRRSPAPPPARRLHGTSSTRPAACDRAPGAPASVERQARGADRPHTCEATAQDGAERSSRRTFPFANIGRMRSATAWTTAAPSSSRIRLGACRSDPSGCSHPGHVRHRWDGARLTPSPLDAGLSSTTVDPQAAAAGRSDQTS
jgi:hypothetical protein